MDPGTILVNALIVIAVNLFTYLLKISWVRLNPQWYAFALSFIAALVVGGLQGGVSLTPAGLLENGAQLFAWSQLVFRALKAVFPAEVNTGSVAPNAPPPRRI